MFLLDVKYNPQNSTITRWIKDGSDCRPEREVFYPKIYVSNEPELLPLIASLPGVKHTYFEEKSTWLGKEPEKVISAAIEPGSVYEIASMLEAKGCSLYNIDLDPVRQYLLEHNQFPMARLRGDILDDSQHALDYEIPELVSKELSVTPGRNKGIITMGDPIGRITLGNTVIENKDEAEMIGELNREVARANPDLILTERGDSFELPYLHHRAALHGIDLQLGREKDILPEGSGKSYFSYGRIIYKPRGYRLAGRPFAFRQVNLSFKGRRASWTYRPFPHNRNTDAGVSAPESRQRSYCSAGQSGSERWCSCSMEAQPCRILEDCLGASHRRQRRFSDRTKSGTA